MSRYESETMIKLTKVVNFKLFLDYTEFKGL